ncbi:hypothetical protein BDA99DRAFT_542872 [Phascolomyces articulosus]|uniref:Uncharacterized protein n=1 Tax=Phascolomyces articulosus TaxID=60185 RepID=A0AAD5JZU1_9FUNG|nr:hypothetical protein BDA99DRAFT_542872 [Phascolomyces articulosus]
MKSILALVLAFIFSVVVNAACTCNEGDTACLEKCVTDANNCIQNCNGSNSCYSGCVDQYWPTSVGSAPSSTASIPMTATGSVSATASASASQTQSATHTPANGSAGYQIKGSGAPVALIFAMVMSILFYH